MLAAPAVKARPRYALASNAWPARRWDRACYGTTAAGVTPRLLGVLNCKPSNPRNQPRIGIGVPRGRDSRVAPRPAGRSRLGQGQMPKWTFSTTNGQTPTASTADRIRDSESR